MPFGEGYKNKSANSIFYQTKGSWADPLYDDNEFNPEFSSPIGSQDLVSTYKQPKQNYKPTTGLDSIINATRNKNFNEEKMLDEARRKQIKIDPVTSGIVKGAFTPIGEAMSSLDKGTSGLGNAIQKFGATGNAEDLGKSGMTTLQGLLHTAFTPFTVPFGAVTGGLNESGQIGKEISTGLNKTMNLPFDVVNRGSKLTGDILGTNDKNLVSPEFDKQANDIATEVLGLLLLGKTHKGVNNFNELAQPKPNLLNPEFRIKGDETVPLETVKDFSPRPNLTKPTKGVTQEKLPTELMSKIETNLKKTEDLVQKRQKTLETPYFEDVNNVPEVANKIVKGKKLNSADEKLKKNFPKELETKLQELQSGKTNEGKTRRDIIKEQRLKDEQSTKGNVSEETQKYIPNDANQTAIDRMTKQGKTPAEISVALNLPKREVVQTVRSLPKTKPEVTSREIYSKLDNPELINFLKKELGEKKVNEIAQKAFDDPENQFPIEGKTVTDMQSGKIEAALNAEAEKIGYRKEGKIIEEDKPDYKTQVEETGLIYNGIQKTGTKTGNLVTWTDPETKSTHLIPIKDFTKEKLIEQRDKYRKDWNTTNGQQPNKEISEQTIEPTKEVTVKGGKEDVGSEVNLDELRSRIPEQDRNILLQNAKALELSTGQKLTEASERRMYEKYLGIKKPEIGTPKQVSTSNLQKEVEKPKKISAKDEFKVGDVIENSEGLKQTIREVKGNSIFFTDENGQDYSGFSRSTLRNLVNGGSWKRVETQQPKVEKQPYEMSEAELLQSKKDQLLEARKTSDENDRWIKTQNFLPKDRTRAVKENARLRDVVRSLETDIKNISASRKDYVQRAINEGKIESHPDYPELGKSKVKPNDVSKLSNDELLKDKEARDILFVQQKAEEMIKELDGTHTRGYTEKTRQDDLDWLNRHKDKLTTQQKQRLENIGKPVSKDIAPDNNKSTAFRLFENPKNKDRDILTATGMSNNRENIVKVREWRKEFESSEENKSSIFIDKGISKEGFEVLGNFNRKMDAESLATETGGNVHGYLNGKYKRGWTVTKTVENQLKPLKPETKSKGIAERIKQLSEYEAQGYNLTHLRDAKRQMLENPEKAKLAFEILDFNKTWFPPELAKDLEKHPLTHLAGNFYDNNKSLKDYVESKIKIAQNDIIKEQKRIEEYGKSKSDIKSKNFAEERIGSFKKDIGNLKSKYKEFTSKDLRVIEDVIPEIKTKTEIKEEQAEVKEIIDEKLKPGLMKKTETSFEFNKKRDYIVNELQQLIDNALDGKSNSQDLPENFRKFIEKRVEDSKKEYGTSKGMFGDKDATFENELRTFIKPTSLRGFDGTIKIQVPDDGIITLKDTQLSELLDLRDKAKRLNLNSVSNNLRSMPQAKKYVHENTDAYDVKSYDADVNLAKENLAEAKKNNNTKLAEIFTEQLKQLEKLDRGEIQKKETYKEAISNPSIKSAIAGLPEYSKQSEALRLYELVNEFGLKKNEVFNAKSLTVAKKIKDRYEGNLQDYIDELSNDILKSEAILKEYERKDGKKGYRKTNKSESRTIVRELEGIERSNKELQYLNNWKNDIEKLLGTEPKPEPTKTEVKVEKTEPKPLTGQSKESRIVSDKSYEEAKSRLNDPKKINLKSGTDPIESAKVLKDLTTVGAYHFENGLRKFSDWSKKMIEEVGEGVRKRLREIWDETKLDILSNTTIQKNLKLDDPLLQEAVKNTKGAKLTDRGLELEIERFQKPEQAEELSVRSSVFYLPELNQPQKSHYSTGKNGYGGRENIQGKTVVKNPIIVKAGTGGRAPQLAYDLINGKGAYEKMRRDVLDNAWGGNLYNRRPDEGAIYDLLEKYGGDSDVVSEIVNYSKEGNTLPYAIQENIVASSVRDAGYDAVLGVTKRKGNLVFSELMDVREIEYPSEVGDFGLRQDLIKRVISDEALQTARENIKSNLSKLSAGIDPTLIKDYAVIGAYHLETVVRTGIKKGTEFRDWAKGMMADLGEGVRPHLRAIWNEVARNKDLAKMLKPYREELVKPVEKIVEPIKTETIKKEVKPVTEKPKRFAPYVGDGETKTRGLSQTTEAKAITSDLTKGIEKLPEYNVKTNLPQIEEAAKIISTDLPRAVRIALGQEVAPNNVLPGFIYKGLEDYAVRNGDVKLLKKLGQSPYLSEQATTAGQFIQSLRNLDPLSPVEAIKDVIKTRQESSAFQRQEKIKAEYEGKIKELEDKLNLKNEALEKIEAEKQYRKVQRQTKVEQRREKRTYTREELKIEREDLYKDLAKTFTLNVGFTADQVKILAKLTKNYAQEGILSAEAVVDAIYTQIADKLDGITKKDIRDAISGYGREIKAKTKDELLSAMNDLRQQMKTISRIEELESGKTPVKKEIKRTEPSEELATLREELKTVLDEHGITDFTNLEKAKKMLRDKIVEYNDKIKSGDFETKKKEPVLDEERTKLQKELDDIRDKWKYVQKTLGEAISEPEAKQIAELSRIAAESKIKMENAPRRELLKEATPEELEYGRARVKFAEYVDNLKESASKLTFEDFKEKPFQTLGKGIAHIPGITKSLKATLDNSGLFNQHIKVLWTHPTIWQRNAIKSFQDIYHVFKGENVLAEISADIISRPNYEKYRKDGVAVGVIEEAFPDSKLIEKIPFIGSKLHKAADTAFTGLAYRNRADLYDLYTKIAENGGNKETTGLGLGKLVNSLTGRGNLGKLEQSANTFNVLFFSPRFVKSHIDVLTAHVFDKNVSPFVKKEAGKNLLKIIGGTAAVLLTAKAMGGDVDLDPRSSNFGKIKVGNTRFNVSGGMNSIVTLASRLIPAIIGEGKTKNSKGELVSLNSGKYGASTGWDVLQNFFDGKLSPVAGVARDVLKGQTFGKEPVTVGRELENLVMPLPITNAKELINDPQSANVLGAMIADAVGIFTNTYSNDPNLNKVKNSILSAGEEKFSAEKRKNFYQALNQALTDKVITQSQLDSYKESFEESQKDAPVKEETKKKKVKLTGKGL